MPEDLKDRLIRYVTYATIFAIFVGGVICTYPTYLQIESLKVENNNLSARIEEKQREIAELKDYQRRFNTDPDFVEHIARQNRQVYPGELVFVFEKE